MLSLLKSNALYNPYNLTLGGCQKGPKQHMLLVSYFSDSARLPFIHTLKNSNCVRGTSGSLTLIKCHLQMIIRHATNRHSSWGHGETLRFVAARRIQLKCTKLCFQRDSHWMRNLYWIPLDQLAASLFFSVCSSNSVDSFLSCFTLVKSLSTGSVPALRFGMTFSFIREGYEMYSDTAFWTPISRCCVSLGFLKNKMKTKFSLTKGVELEFLFGSDSRHRLWPSDFFDSDSASKMIVWYVLIFLLMYEYHRFMQKKIMNWTH